MDELTPELVSSRLNATGRDWELVGSRVTCDPAPTDTDSDYLVLGPVDEGSRLDVFIKEFGFVHEGEPDNLNYQECDFASYRKGSINLIVCESGDFYGDFQLATEVAKHLNLLNKVDRIILFQALLYKNYIGVMELIYSLGKPPCREETPI